MEEIYATKFSSQWDKKTPWPVKRFAILSFSDFSQFRFVFRLIHAFSSPWPTFGSLTFALGGGGYLGLKHVTALLQPHTC